MIAADPDGYFRLPCVGPSGWVGVSLDRGVDWVAVKPLVADSYQLVAPKPKRAKEPVARRKNRDLHDGNKRPAQPRLFHTGRGY